jgi:hypothetical protein
MSDFKTRLQEEYVALGDKLGKLNTFLQGDQIKELPANQQDLLKKQSVHMTDYYNVLKERIDLLEKDASVSSTFENAPKDHSATQSQSATADDKQGPGNQSQSAGLSSESQTGDQAVKD